MQGLLEICERFFQVIELSYNFLDRNWKFAMARFLFILYLSVIAMGLFPLTQPMSSMQTMHMDEMTISHQSKMERSGAGNSMGSCCDEIAPFSVGCALLVPEYTFFDSFGGSNKVIIPNLVVQSIYIETLTPPPKA